MRRIWAIAAALCCAGCALFLADDSKRLEEWQHQTVLLRGLAFKRPVALRWVDEAEMKEVLVAEAATDLEPARVTAERDALAALGALPPDIDLAKELLGLYASQVAGVYSPRRATLFVNDSNLGALKSIALGPIVVHELTHALQDQNFPEILDFLLGLEDEDDVGRALSGTVEGDATVTMFGALPGARPDVERVPAAELARDAMLDQLNDPKTAFGRAPRLLAVSLVFPYAYGTVIAARRWDAAGNAGLDSQLVEPPLSTLQILRPETRAPVEFVKLPDDLAPEGCTLDYANVAGALLLRVLFEASLHEPEREALVSAWRGDRYAKLGCGGAWELVWLTRWAAPEAAERFAKAYESLAPGIAEHTPLRGRAQVVVRGRTALAVTPGLLPHADAILSGSEVRAYEHFSDWAAGGCFPDRACPSREKVQRADLR
jgi:hypothetical protein